MKSRRAQAPRSRRRRLRDEPSTLRSLPPPPPRHASFIRATSEESAPTERAPETIRSPRAHSVAVRPSVAAFQREVARVLVGYYGVRAEQAVRLVARWRRYIQKQWSKGRPATNVADHVSRWTQEGEPCPCPH